MEIFEQFVYWDHNYNIVLLVNLAIVIGLFTFLRFFSGAIAHLNASDELLKRDNAAFGISLAGMVLAVTYLLGGAMYGNPGNSITDSIIFIVIFAVFGIVLMGLTRIIFDRFALPGISFRDEIHNGNIAIAIVDVSNMIAAAIIIRAVTIWVTDYSLDGLIALFGGYAVSQIVLTLTTISRRRVFAKLYPENSVQDELKRGNVAFALDFAGKKIATAFAISIAANIVVFEVYNIVSIILPWIIVSGIFIVLIKFFAFIAEKIILFHVDTKLEVIDQRNIAIGALLAAINISIAILISGL